MSSYLPVALDLRRRRCLVVGAGAVAATKLEALLSSDADVLVVAPRIGPAVTELLSHYQFETRQRPFETADLEGMFLVMAATDDPAVNTAVAAAGRDRGALVNSSDDPGHCDFIMPAILKRDGIQLAVTTGGRSPALARHLRQRLDALVPRAYGPLADILRTARQMMRDDTVHPSNDAWQASINDAVLAQVDAGELEGALGMVLQTLRTFDASRARAPGNRSAIPGGRIVLVGAGPGDPGLLTVAGQEALAAADVVVYDRLVNPELLQHLKATARVVFAGKTRGRQTLSQTQINELLCAEAQAGRLVVRLKGGDPFVFGRGGEEALAAAAAGVPFTVIPGVTSAIGVPAYAGIPVTHRGMASAFTVVTGHEDPSKASSHTDWRALARVGGTLVLLMSVGELRAITSELIAGGLDPAIPVAVIQDGTLPTQRVIRATLGDIAERAIAAGIAAPATTVVGHVAELADLLDWWPPAASHHVAAPPSARANQAASH